jgi:hypothetical protein
MWSIACDMLSEASRLGVPVSLVDEVAADRLRSNLLQKYGRSKMGWPLWDGPSDDVSVQDESAWRWIADFLNDGPCVILWEPGTERKALRFSSGVGLVAVLAECHRTEFYVTDDVTSFMLCFNHHDYLIGAGHACKWLADRSREP